MDFPVDGLRIEWGGTRGTKDGFAIEGERGVRRDARRVRVVRRIGHRPRTPSRISDRPARGLAAARTLSTEKVVVDTALSHVFHA